MVYGVAGSERSIKFQDLFNPIFWPRSDVQYCKLCQACPCLISNGHDEKSYGIRILLQDFTDGLSTLCYLAQHCEAASPVAPSLLYDNLFMENVSTNTFMQRAYL